MRVSLRRHLHWLFVGLYVAGLFGFAWAFQLMADDFFFSPYAIRGEIQRHSERLMASLQESQLDHSREHVGSLANDGWMVWNQGTRFTAVTASEDGKITLRLVLPTFQIMNGQREYVIYPLVLGINGVTSFPPGWPDSLKDMVMTQWVTVEELAHPGIRRALFDSILTSPTMGGHVIGALSLSYGQAQDLQALVDAQGGSSKGLRPNYWRFWYLSAVTITTLGYGDVVPMTTRARMLVGSEAVFGVFVAGAFLSRFLSRPRKERLATNRSREP